MGAATWRLMRERQAKQAEREANAKATETAVQADPVEPTAEPVQAESAESIAEAVQAETQPRRRGGAVNSAAATTTATGNAQKQETSP